MMLKETILSSYQEFPFGNSLRTFFENYIISENVECYYLHHSPWKCDKNTTSFDQLHQINYQSKIIFWVVMDTIIDNKRYDFYYQEKIEVLEKLENICKLNADKKFILLIAQHNLQRQVSVKNLFISNVLNLKLPAKYTECIKKSSNSRWVTFNRNPNPHKLGLVSYLASKNIDKHGSINFDCEHFLMEKYNFFRYFKFNDEEKKELKKGFYRVSLGNIKNHNIPPFESNFVENYNKNLLTHYENSHLEIIAGSLFFEPTPYFSEKEVQSVYGKVFPIFINTHNAVSTWKKIHGMDVFEDIIDHTYDSIEDPTKRLLSAINLNMHLLNGTTDLVKLWIKNKERFEENCQQMNKLLYDEEFQQKIDQEQIKKALDYFQIQYTPRV